MQVLVELGAWHQPRREQMGCMQFVHRAKSYCAGRGHRQGAIDDGGTTPAALARWLTVLATLLTTQKLLGDTLARHEVPSTGMAVFLDFFRNGMRAVSGVLCHIDHTSRALAADAGGPSTQLATCTPREVDACATAVQTACSVSSTLPLLFDQLFGEEGWEGVPGTDPRWANACARLGRDAAGLLQWAVTSTDLHNTLSELSASAPVRRTSRAEGMPPGLEKGVGVEWLQRCLG